MENNIKSKVYTLNIRDLFNPEKKTMKIDIVLHKSSSMYISENKSIVLTMKKCKLSQYTKKKTGSINLSTSTRTANKIKEMFVKIN